MKIELRCLAVFFAVCVGCVAVPSRADAQMPAATAQTPSAASASDAQAGRDLDYVISILQDDTRRQALLAELKARQNAGNAAGGQTSASTATESPQAQAAPSPAAETVVVTLSEHVREFSEQALRLAASMGEFPRLIASAIDDLRNPSVRSARIDVLWRMFAALAAGLVCEAAAFAALARARRPFEVSAPRTVVGRLIALLARALIEAAPVVVFIAATLILLPVFATPQRARLAAILLIDAHAGVRAALILARILVAPGTPQLRLFVVAEETAQYLYIWIRRIAVVGIYGTLAASAASLLGLSTFAHQAALKVVGALLAVLLIIFILQNRSTVAQAIARDGGVLMGVRRPIAEIWHILAILYLIGLFGVWFFDVPGGFDYLGRASLGTAITAIGAWLLTATMTRVVARAFRLSPDLTNRFPGLETRANRYLQVLREVMRAVIWLFALLLVLSVWGVHSFEWLSSKGGVDVVGSAVAIVVILLIALVIWEAFTLVLERYSARLIARGTGGARARTLLPLFRTTAFVVLAVLAGLVILTEIGINITPLLAGAGVVGLAVGFGSQKLVQDVINGAFILVEDTIAVGDVVDLGGGHAGAVEAISIRTIRLRDGNGTVHTIPFSEVHVVQNMTRDFAKALFEISVDYHEDVERVIAAMKETGEALSCDKALASFILEPFSIIGVDKLAGSGVVVMAQIATLPGKQWDVSRAFNRSLKHRFDELGIEMPPAHTTIYVQGDRAERASVAPRTSAEPAPKEDRSP